MSVKQRQAAHRSKTILRLNALRECGWLFPRLVMVRQNPFDSARTPGHLHLLKAISSSDTAAFEAEIGAREDAKVIISIENLFSDQPDQILRILGTYFQDWKVSLIAILRPQLDWLQSRYVENVLSGFNTSPDYFRTHVHRMLKSGALDYEGRLAHLQTILGAGKVTALAFGEPLVQRFLEILEIPQTNPALAGEIHANRREKGAFLIEANRRLNILTDVFGQIRTFGAGK